MHRPQRLLADLERADKKRLSLFVRALGLVDYGDVIEAFGDVEMHQAQRLLADLECANVERLGFVVDALLLVEQG